jgi:hypothetical protein
MKVEPGDYVTISAPESPFLSGFVPVVGSADLLLPRCEPSGRRVCPPPASPFPWSERESESELIDALLLKYDVDRKTCEQDVLKFLEDLQEDGILQVEYK